MTVTDPSVLSAIAAINATAAAVKANLVERDDVIDMALASLVAETNVFLCGQPGIAKSAVFGDLFKRIDRARKGFYALTKASVPDMLVGPMSIKALTEEDRVAHQTRGMLPEVDLAFIDEVFKGNALTRNALLTILNERTFYNGGQIQACPLIMAAAASNEYPDAHEDAAFWDRFTVRMHVERIGSRDGRRAMIRAGLARGRRFIDGAGTITLEQLRTLHEARKSVVIPEAVYDTLDEILAVLDAADLDAAIGDRRVMESFHVVAAHALLDGRMEATADDLTVLTHTLWGVPDTRREIQKTIHKVINPHLATLADMLDAIIMDFEKFASQAKDFDAKGAVEDKFRAHKQFNDAASIQVQAMEDVVNAMERTGQVNESARKVVADAKNHVMKANSIALFGSTKALDENAA